MSGHSKWSKIKHQKAIKDPRKGKLFSQLSKQIQIAAKQGDPDPEKNAALRKAIEVAKAANMPKDNIQRAINKAAGIGQEENLESFTLEGYGPGGVAILIKAETDNRNRTISEIRHIFKGFEGSLGEPGSAAFVFGSDPENPSFRTPITSPVEKDKFDNLIEKLQSHEDVSTIYHNLA